MLYCICCTHCVPEKLYAACVLPSGIDQLSTIDKGVKCVLDKSTCQQPTHSEWLSNSENKLTELKISFFYEYYCCCHDYCCKT